MTTKLLTYALTFAMSLGATALAISNRTVRTTTSQEPHFAADGAFRDGLYLGKLAAQQGQPLRPAIGRWSTDQDRVMFMAGYRLGYSQVLRVSHRGGDRLRERRSTGRGASEQRG